MLQSDARIDLLITDVGLPGGMNGRQMADAARAKRPELKVLFITGYAENAVVGNGQLEPGMRGADQAVRDVGAGRAYRRDDRRRSKRLGRSARRYPRNPSTRRAMDWRCTSLGPSYIRMMRAFCHSALSGSSIVMPSAPSVCIA